MDVSPIYRKTAQFSALLVLLLVPALLANFWSAGTAQAAPGPCSRSRTLYLARTASVYGRPQTLCLNVLVPAFTRDLDVTFEVDRSGRYELYWRNSGGSPTLIADFSAAADRVYVFDVDSFSTSSQDRSHRLIVQPRNVGSAERSVSVSIFAKSNNGRLLAASAGEGSGSSGSPIIPGPSPRDSTTQLGANGRLIRQATLPCGGLLEVGATFRQTSSARIVLYDPQGRVMAQLRETSGSFFYPVSPAQGRRGGTWRVEYVNRDNSARTLEYTFRVSQTACPQPTATPTRRPATRTPTPPPSGNTSGVRQGVVQVQGTANVRRGPGVNFALARRIGNNVIVRIYEERSTNDSRYRVWYRIDSSSGPWIWAGLVRLTSSGSPSTQPDSQTARFQRGRYPSSTFSGAVEAVLSEDSPNSNDRSQGCLVDGDDPPGSGKDKSTILWWDVSSLPNNARIERVTITLSVFNPSDDTYRLYALRQRWTSGGVNWNRPMADRIWLLPGARSSSDRDSTALGSVRSPAAGTATIVLNSTGRQIVSDWVSGLRANRGFILASDSAIDGLDFHCSTASTRSQRPLLTITYRR